MAGGIVEEGSRTGGVRGGWSMEDRSMVEVRSDGSWGGLLVVCETWLRGVAVCVDK